MKKFRGSVIYPMILGLMVGCLLPMLAFAVPSTPAITGNWLGTLLNFRLVFIISEKPDHSLSVIVQSLDQRGSNIPTENATFKDKVLHFDSSVIQSSYNGKLSEDGTELEGYWNQNGTHPLTLKKIDKVPVFEYVRDAKDVDGLKRTIDQLVEPLIKGGWDKAMAVGVIYKGQKRVWGYGNASLTGDKVPNGDTEFEVGSITKIFTRLMFIDMIQKGQMKLDDPAQMYLPSGVKMPSYNGKQISLFHLAQHLAGLPHDPDDLDWNGPDTDPQSKYTLQRLYDYLGRVKLTREPGVQPEYSNTGVALLGDMIVSKSGMSYEDYLQQLVCLPLDLKDTGVVWTEDQLSRAAQGYDGKGDPTPLWKWTEPTFIGAGAIHSTANDLLKLAQDLFKPTTTEPLQKLTTYNFADQLGWGYFVTHDGQTAQFNSSFYVDRDNQWAVVVWGSRCNMKASALAAEVRKVVKGIKPIPLDLPEMVKAPASKLKPFVGRYRVEQVDSLSKNLAGKVYKLEAKKGHFVSINEITKVTSPLYLTSNGDLFEENGTILFSPIKDSQGQIVGMVTKPNQIYSMTLRKLDSSGNPMEWPLVSKGKALDSPGGKLLVDNFESGKTQNPLGGSWVVQFDDHNLGTVLKDKDQFIVKGGPKGSSYCARIYGHFGFSRDPWPYVQLFTTLGTQGPVDLSGFRAIVFMAKGDGKNYEVMMNTPSVTDYCYFRVPFKSSNDWTLQHMDLDSFNQPGWGKKVLRDFGSVTQILYQPSEMSDQDFDLWIDDVTLVK